MTSQNRYIQFSRNGYLVLTGLSLALLACSGTQEGSQATSDEVAQNTDGHMQPGSETNDGVNHNTGGDQDLPVNGGDQDLPVNDSDQDRPTNDGAGEPGSVGELPVDPNANPAGGTSLNLNELLETPECKAGWLANDPETEAECAATFREICFKTNEAACLCAGCSNDECAIAESYPTQVSCQVDSLGCNFMWTDACFETAEEACAAAGCGTETCLIAESFPAQVSCQ